MSKPLYNGCATATDVTRAFEHAHKDITALEDKVAHLIQPSAVVAAVAPPVMRELFPRGTG